jgi:uncharacterized protein
MLRSFQVGNHRSIRQEQELALIPAYEKDAPVVPVAAIYGGNATGKSNLVSALRFMQRAVRSSFRTWEAGQRIPREPFRLGVAMLAEPSTFVVNLQLADGEFVYGFGVDDARVVDEWLYAYGASHRKTVVFERAGLQVTLGDSLPERSSRAKLLTRALRDNALVLSTAMQLGEQPEFAPVYRWFARNLRFVTSTPPFLVDRVAGTLASHSSFVELVRTADLDITDVRVVTIEPPPSAAEEAALDGIGGEIRRLSELAEVVDDEESLADVSKRVQRLERERQTLRSRTQRRELVFMHGEELTKLAPREQSEGTLAYVHLLTYVLDALAGGSTLVVDEIDTSLHPRLVARVVELFRDPRTNPHTAQLVFTTHDATLLGTSFGREILRRDEIWFTDKRDGATHLYPLTDFHPRKEDNRERRYLGGSYGGVPAVFSDTLVASLLKAREEATDATP